MTLYHCILGSTLDNTHTVFEGHAISQNRMELVWNIPQDSKMQNDYFNN